MGEQTIKLEPTGERMIMEEYHACAEDHLIYVMHMSSYKFARHYTEGKRVLDFGCGSGYGSASIAETARSVQAVDVAQDAVDYAKANFSRPNLFFTRIAPDAQIPFADESFDVVLSFQVFEHVKNTNFYLHEVRRVLVPGGRLILITPDRSTRLLPLQQPWDRWHLREYSQGELRRILRGFFPQSEVMGMSGRPDVIDLEIRRCRRIKWLTLFCTLPLTPHTLRVAALNTIHRYRGRGGTAKPSRAYDFSEDDIYIAPNAAPSVNIVCVCKKI